MGYNYLNLSLKDVEKNGKKLVTFLKSTNAKLITQNLKGLTKIEKKFFIKIAGLIFSENSNVLPKSIKSSLNFLSMQELQNNSYDNDSEKVFVNMKKNSNMTRELNNFFIFASAAF